MTDRRRSHHRRRHHDHLLGGAGLAVLVGAVVLVGFDSADRNLNRFRAETRSSRGLEASEDVATLAMEASSRSPMIAASMVPGEIVIEAAGSLPEGSWRLGERALPSPPVILDSVAAGPHRLSFLEADTVRWEISIDLPPGGIKHVMVPALGSSDAGRAVADSLER